MVQQKISKPIKLFGFIWFGLVKKFFKPQPNKCEQEFVWFVSWVVQTKRNCKFNHFSIQSKLEKEKLYFSTCNQLILMIKSQILSYTNTAGRTTSQTIFLRPTCSYHEVRHLNQWFGSSRNYWHKLNWSIWIKLFTLITFIWTNKHFQIKPSLLFPYNYNHMNFHHKNNFVGLVNFILV